MTAIVAAGLKGTHSRRAEAEAILADRLRGDTIYELERRYGLTSSSIYRRLDEAIKHRVAPTVDAYRAQQNEILDKQMRRLEEQIGTANALAQVAIETRSVDGIEKAANLKGKAIDGIVRLSDRRAKLNGLDAPVRVDVTVTEQTQADAELQQILREARARRAVEA